MRTEDRVSAAAKRPVPVGPMAGAGDRLPTPPRERKPALAALAALLVLVGALGATLLVMRAGDRIEAIRIVEAVPAGQPIPEEAMESVMVADDPSVSYVEWSQRSQLSEFLSQTDLVEGTVLVGQMLGEDDGLDEDERIVGVTLQPGQYPPGLEAGDRIDAYWVGDEVTETDEETGTTPDPLLVEGARVAEINGEEDEADGNSALALRLRVNEEEAPALTRAASQNEVTVVIVGSGGSD
jgi:hypothetical protein